MNILKTIKKNLSYFTIVLGIFSSTDLYADHEPVEQISVGSAFKVINQRLYRLNETKIYCNTNFSKQSSRNNDAYDQWELQYNFFLREFDKNYAAWKAGFTKLEQQQFPTLEFIERGHLKNKIMEEYKEGGLDKCYNYKPSLQRPRNNIELSEQESINIIRDNALNGFINARESSGANAQCAWDQNKAIDTISHRNDGKDLKAQKILLKNMKKSKSDLDKKIKSKQLSNYGEMIGEVYKAPSLQSLTYSQYRFAICERDINDVNSKTFKKALPLLLQCQETSANDIDLLGNCINKALNK